MNDFLKFISLQDSTVRMVVLGVVLLGASTSTVGTFTFLRKKSLIGDAIAHSVLPGICLAFIFIQVKNPLILLLGAFISGWISIFLIDYITRKSRLKADTVIGLVLSVFFGFGILLLTYIQSGGNAAMAGLNNFLFGQAASLVGQDVYLIAGVCLLLVLAVYLLYKEFVIISFDQDYGATLGLPVKLIEVLLSTLTVLAIAVGIQAVGVVLMAAMLITPAAAARYWTNDLRKMILVAASFGALAGILGAYVSYAAPKMPTGPWIIVAISVIAFISILFAPERGVLMKQRMKRLKRGETLRENILKIFFHLGEADGDYSRSRTQNALQERRFIDKAHLKKGLNQLCKQDMLEEDGGAWTLTEAGLDEAMRIARLHRLWEMYLSKYLHMEADHVHEGAESLEHFITPEMELILEKELGFPETDPHDKPIPYKNTING